MISSKFVLDSSVLIKWFKEKDEPHVKQARIIKNNYLNGLIKIAVPELIFYEIGNVLCLKCRLNKEEAAKKLVDFYNLGLEVVSLTPQISSLAVNFSFDFHLTFYDATFLATADFLGFSFVTADADMYHKIKELMPVTFLSEIK